MFQRIFDSFLKRSTLAKPDSALFKAFGGAQSSAGVDVTAESALNYTTVYACVSLIAENIASLPLVLYKKNGKNKDRATDHYLYPLLHDAPNDEMTSFNWREAFVSQLLLWGTGYNWKVTGEDGRIKAIYPLESARMTVERINGKIVHRCDGEVASGIMAVPALGFNGIVGKSPISVAKQAIGLGLATEEFGARYFGSGTNPSLRLYHPQRLSKEAADRLKESIGRNNSGLQNSHKIMVFEEGMKAENATIPPEDSQFLQTRSFQRSEICAIYRVPPFMVGDVEKQTSWGAGIEQQQIGFVTHTIRPWLVRIEQILNLHLLSDRERAQGYFIEFLVDGLLRGDLKSRYEAYAIGRTNGFLNANEIRSLENLNPREGGDIYLDQVNMAPTDTLAADKQQDDARSAINKSFERLFKVTAERVLRRETNTIRKTATKTTWAGAGSFTDAVEKFYKNFKTDISRDFLPIYQSYAESIGVKKDSDFDTFVQGRCDEFAERYTRTSIEQLTVLAEKNAIKDLGEAVIVLLDGWTAERANKVAKLEITKFEAER